MTTAEIDCETERPNELPQRLRIRAHELRADVVPAVGSTDSAPGPHDHFDLDVVGGKCPVRELMTTTDVLIETAPLEGGAS